MIALNELGHLALCEHLAAHAFEENQSSQRECAAISRTLQAEKDRCAKVISDERARVDALIQDRKSRALATFNEIADKLVAEANGALFSRGAASELAVAYTALDRALLEGVGEHCNPSLLVRPLISDDQMHAFAVVSINFTAAIAALAASIRAGDHGSVIANLIEAVEAEMHGAVKRAPAPSDLMIALARASLESATTSDASIAIQQVNGSAFVAPPAIVNGEPRRSKVLGDDGDVRVVVAR